MSDTAGAPTPAAADETTAPESAPEAETPATMSPGVYLPSVTQ